MATKSTQQKESRKSWRITAWFFIALLVLGAIGWVYNKATVKNTSQLHQYFIYTQNEKSYLYDLNTNMTTPINGVHGRVSQFTWTNDGNVLIITDANDIYVYIVPTAKTIKIADHFPGSLVQFEKTGDKITYQEWYRNTVLLLPNDPINSNDIVRYFSMDFAGNKKEITEKEWDTRTEQGLQKALISTDGKFSTEIQEAPDGFLGTVVVNKENAKRYVLPKYFFNPLFSPDAMHIGVIDGADSPILNSFGSLKIFSSIKDIQEKSANPILQIPQVYMYGWMDTKSLVYVQMKETDPKTQQMTFQLGKVSLLKPTNRETLATFKTPYYDIQFGASLDGKRVLYGYVSEDDNHDMSTQVEKIYIINPQTKVVERQFNVQFARMSPLMGW